MKTKTLSAIVIITLITLYAHTATSQDLAKIFGPPEHEGRLWMMSHASIGQVGNPPTETWNKFQQSWIMFWSHYHLEANPSPEQVNLIWHSLNKNFALAISLDPSCQVYITLHNVSISSPCSIDGQIDSLIQTCHPQSVSKSGLDGYSDVVEVNLPSSGYHAFYRWLGFTKCEESALQSIIMQIL